VTKKDEGEKAVATVKSTVGHFSLVPTTLDEAIKYSDMIAKSDLVPKDYKGNAGNVLIAVQMGAEIGLKPLQALQNIAVINGRPCVWGDALPAIIQASGTVEAFAESFDEKTMTATCKATRKGTAGEIVRTFSKADAEKAGLWAKAGTWQNYPKRMLQLRARAWALRDGWADWLKGLGVAEEVQDTPPAHTPSGSSGFIQPAEKVAPVVDAQIVQPAPTTASTASPAKAVNADPVTDKPAETAMDDTPKHEIVNMHLDRVMKRATMPTTYAVYSIDGDMFVTDDASKAVIAREHQKAGKMVTIEYDKAQDGTLILHSVAECVIKK